MVVEGVKKLRGYLGLLILYLLSKEPLHGYAILKKLRELLGHERLSTGVLYPALRALRKKGLIGVRDEVRGSRLVKVYYLTDVGAEFLEERKRELGEALRFVRGLRLLREIGAEHIFRAFRLIQQNLDRIDEEKKRKLSQLFEEFEKRVEELLGVEQ